MTKQIKEAAVKTNQAANNIFEVAMLGATTAVAVKAAAQPLVSTAQGNLPLWQIASALVLSGVAYKLYKLQSK